MIRLGTDWLNLLQSRMETVQRLLLYSGTMPPNPDIIPSVTGVIGDIASMSPVPFTPEGYSIEDRIGLTVLFNSFVGGKYHLTESTDVPLRLLLRIHSKPNNKNFTITEQYLDLSVDTNVNHDVYIGGAFFTDDGLLLYVQTSRGTDADNVTLFAKTHIYELSSPYDLTTATLHSIGDLSSGATGTEGAPYPSGYIWDASGNSVYVISHSNMYRFNTIISGDLRQQRFAGSNARTDINPYGGGSSAVFWDSGKYLAIIQGGYTNDEFGNTLTSGGVPVWSTPKISIFELGTPYQPETITSLNPVQELDLTQWFSEYQNDNIISSRFSISVDETTGLCYVSGITGVNQSRTVVFQIPITSDWLGGAAVGESDLISDVSDLFPTALGGNKLDIVQAQYGIELHWKREQHEIIKKKVDNSGDISFFCLQTAGRGGTIWITGTVGLVGSGASLELNRTVVGVNDQVNIANFNIKLTNVVPILL